MTDSPRADGPQDLDAHGGLPSAGWPLDHGAPRVRSHHCRFRNRGTDSLSEFGIKWMGGSTKRQCGRTLGALYGQRVLRREGGLLRAHPPGLRTQGWQGGRPAPLVRPPCGPLHAAPQSDDSHLLPIAAACDLMVVAYRWSAWLTESYHPRHPHARQWAELRGGRGRCCHAASPHCFSCRAINAC